MKKWNMFLAMLIAVAFSMPAFAGEGPKPGKGPRGPKGPNPIHEKMEKDGFVVIADLPTDTPERAKEWLGKVDADKDGKVTKDEMKTFFDAKKKEWEERKSKAKAGHDAFREKMDKDGFVLISEVPAEAPEHFKNFLAKADADKDGKVTKEEMKAAFKEFKPKRGDKGKCPCPKADKGMCPFGDKCPCPMSDKGKCPCPKADKGKCPCARGPQPPRPGMPGPGPRPEFRPGQGPNPGAFMKEAYRDGFKDGFKAGLEAARKGPEFGPKGPRGPKGP
ncbi:MAG: hypothetical protein Q4D38_14020, partial [Planctomycetia bacterium]|nr:hypothetical protein [Planctomycetia bacterium]